MARIAAVLLVLVFAVAFESSWARISIRSRREVEREDSEVPPPSETVVISDKEEGVGDRTRYDFIPTEKKNETEVMDVDFNEDDGTFSFGGRFPTVQGFNGGFSDLFDTIAKRFEEMAKRMHESFNVSSAKYPDNYNNTETDIVTIDGRRYLKKKTVIKKGGAHSSIFVSSVTYEAVNDEENSESAETGRDLE